MSQAVPLHTKISGDTMNYRPVATRSDGRRISTGEARDLSGPLFRRLTTLKCGTYEHYRVRNILVELNLPLVHFVSARFRSTRISQEDLVQVATIGLIKAVDRFDPDRAVEFATYAVPTIRGEINHHFREAGWAVRVPRRLQELRLQLVKAGDELTQTCGRAPTTAMLAGHLGLDEDEIREGMLASHAYTANSLDMQFNDQGEPGLELLQRIGTLDPALEKTDNLVTLKALLRQLTERERTILALRFCAGRTQAQIGAELGLSQMHVSRLLARTLRRLREGMLIDR